MKKIVLLFWGMIFFMCILYGQSINYDKSSKQLPTISPIKAGHSSVSYTNSPPPVIINKGVTVEKLCKTWHMDRTILIAENAPAEFKKLGEEYRRSYEKYDCTNMTFAYNGLSKQDDGSYKEYYVHTGSWELLEDQHTLVKYNTGWDAATKIRKLKIISLTDSELILMEESQLDKPHYADGRIGIGFIWVYFCD